MSAFCVKFSQFVEGENPIKIAIARVMALCNDTFITHFRNILNGLTTQTLMERVILRRPAGESEESVFLEG